MTRFDTLTLRAIGETLAVDWSPVDRLPPPAVRVLDHRPAAPRLTVRLRAEPEPTDEELRAAFVEFLKREAAKRIPPVLAALADEAGIPRPPHVRIGLTRSRWASRSSSGTVSLSILLLFLPAPVADHVLLHELSHVVHMDHSPAFHARLRQLDPLSESHSRALRSADRDYLPPWLRFQSA